MKYKTNFIKKDLYYNSIYDLFEKIQKGLTEYKVIYNSDKYFVNNNSFHFLKDFIKTLETPENKPICKLIDYSMDKLEMTSGTSAELFLHILCSLVLENKNNSLKTLNSKVLLPLIQTKFQENTIIATQELLNQQIVKENNNELLSSLIIETINLSGFGGKIYVEDGKIENYFIERKTGFNFKSHPFHYFLKQSNSTWEYYDVKVLIIDGFIDKVSDIDQILTKAYETKQPMILLARSFSEEIIATLRANFDNNNFNIIPVQIPIETTSLNTLKDIAFVCSSDVYSSISGDILSLIKWEELKEIKKIVCSRSGIIFEPTQAPPGLALHLKSIVEKRYNDMDHEDLLKIYDERIKSLTNNSVIIHLPKMSEIENNSIRALIDRQLRLVKTWINYGFINMNIVDELFNLKIKRDDLCPSLSLFLACIYALDINNHLFNSNGIIVQDCGG